MVFELFSSRAFRVVDDVTTDCCFSLCAGLVTLLAGGRPRVARFGAGAGDMGCCAGWVSWNSRESISGSESDSIRLVRPKDAFVRGGILKKNRDYEFKK